MGNPEGDVTVVEFFDYNCPYCRRSTPELTGLLEGDEDVRLVMWKWPILGEGSVFAARAALAAREQNMYQEMHEALMALQQPADKMSVRRLAEALGVDVDRLKADMESPEIEKHIATSMRLAEALGITGTPSFVVGDQLIAGYVEQAVLDASLRPWWGYLRAAPSSSMEHHPRSGADWTAGCMAVSNREIEIYAMLQDGTPVYIKP